MQGVDELSVVADKETASPSALAPLLGPTVVTALAPLLGPTLVTKDKDMETAAVRGKYFGIYFSAHWCPPCRRFTPLLVEFYNKFKASHELAENFDVAFVSWDKSEEEFASYYAEMPWTAVPYKDRDVKDKLGKKFKVCGWLSETIVLHLHICDRVLGSIRIL